MKHIAKGLVAHKTKKKPWMRFFPWFSIGVLGFANLCIFGLVFVRFVKPLG